MSTIHLVKLHATGNDFLVWSWLDDDAGVQGVLGAQAAALCDRRRGIGADGLIVVRSGNDGADVEMVLFNADGEIAEMSGNGIRCLAEVAVRAGRGDGTLLVVDTGAGRRSVELDLDAAGALVGATVDMGPVTFAPAEIPVDAPSAFDLRAELDGVEYRGDAAGMGNPHLVLLVDDPAAARVAHHGPRLEHDARFPRRTNVEFVAAAGHDELTMRVWERGVGETLSCGTGACAAAAVANRRGLVGEDVVVHVPGGELRVGLGDTIRLGGPVVRTFEVDVDVARLGGSHGT
jgi:diaminopimelate epimerase